MKTKKYNWKYVLMGIFCMGFAACTHDSADEPNPVVKDEISRSTITIERTITLTTPGTLQEQLEAAMAGEDVATLQKLTLVGPYNGWDVEYWKTALTNLIEFDLKDAVPTYTEDVTVYDEWGNDCRQHDNEIMVNSFYEMSSLEKIVFPSSITCIKRFACKGCTNLTEVIFPANLNTIEEYVFDNCGFTSIEIPSSVTRLGYGAFRDNLKLKSVKILADITHIESSTFFNCTELETVEFSPSIKEIGNDAFYSCGFTELIIPSTIIIIGSEAFDRCESLTKVTLNEGLESIGYCAFRGVPITEINIPSTVTELAYGAFESTQLKVVTIPETVTTVGGTLFNYCHSLAAIFWNSPAEVADVYDLNPNCYLYLANDHIATGPNWKNVVININGEYVAESVTLCEGGQRDTQNMSYSVPKAFKAKKIKYERRFFDYDWQSECWTYPGECSGWQTIVLPFTPTKIEHETKGEVAPFNSPRIEEANAKPFWLRELTAEGFKDVTEMKPHTPYIIAMPNHDSYMDEYRLYGKIIFSAENVELASTEDDDFEFMIGKGPEYDLQPTYHFVQHDQSVYALNVVYWIDGYHYGSVFARSSSDVYAFEAYVTTGGRLARSTFGIDTSSDNTRSAKEKNTTGIPQIGDM